jgi:hypothetical protein
MVNRKSRRLTGGAWSAEDSVTRTGEAQERKDRLRRSFMCIVLVTEAYEIAPYLVPRNPQLRRAKIPCQMCDMRAHLVLDVVVESRETIYELPNPEPGGNEPNLAPLLTNSVYLWSSIFVKRCLPAIIHPLVSRTPLVSEI